MNSKYIILYTVYAVLLEAGRYHTYNEGNTGIIALGYVNCT